MLRSALGPAIAAWLDDANVAEIMLNADGRLWVDHLDTGIAATDERLSPLQAERIIRLVAHHVGAEVHRGAPRVSAELPEGGERFEGLLPPVVTEPVFSIRRPASLPLALTDYVAAGTMTATAAAYLAQAVQTRLGLFTGEWFLDTTDGTPWRTEVLGKYTQDSYDAVIKDRILTTMVINSQLVITAGVKSIAAYSSTFDPDARKLRVTTTIDTIYGEAKIDSTL